MIALVKTHIPLMLSSFFFLSSGSTVFAEIQGVIDACIKLSGMPDLSLSFMVSFSLLFYSPLNTCEVLNEMINIEISLHLRLQRIVSEIFLAEFPKTVTYMMSVVFMERLREVFAWVCYKGLKIGWLASANIQYHFYWVIICFADMKGH